MNPTDRFYILWNPGHPSPPRVRFSTRESAAKTAERMCLEHHSQFYVMEAIDLIRPSAPPAERIPIRAVPKKAQRRTK